MAKYQEKKKNLSFRQISIRRHCIPGPKMWPATDENPTGRAQGRRRMLKEKHAFRAGRTSGPPLLHKQRCEQCRRIPFLTKRFGTLADTSLYFLMFVKKHLSRCVGLAF